MNTIKNALTIFFILMVPMVCKTQNIYTVAGNGVAGYSGDGLSATSMYCELNDPLGMCTDAYGNIYFSDAGNSVIREINSSGIITTFAGSHILGAGFSGDGGQATDGQLNSPYGLCVDKSGNIYIADYSNNAIRKIDTSGIIFTIAGIGVSGFNGDGGPAISAELNQPAAVFVDLPGNVYIGDCGNRRIRKIDTTGYMSSIAGNGKGGFSGDGGLADTSEIYTPFDIKMDKLGNIYFCDPAYNVERIRKINTSGIISTIAGIGVMGFSGDGGPATSAELYAPIAFSLDSSSNIYFADQGNQRIRKIDSFGNISTIAGNGKVGFSGDGGPATSAELNYPDGVALDVYGDIYFADQLNQRIRKIVLSTGITDVLNNENVSIYPIPTSQILNINAGGLYARPTILTIMDITGREVLSQSILTNIMQLDVSSLSSGMYFLCIKNKDIYSIQKFIKQ